MSPADPNSNERALSLKRSREDEEAALQYHDQLPFELTVGAKELASDTATRFHSLVTFDEGYIKDRTAAAAQAPTHVLIMTDVSLSMEGIGIHGASEAIKKIPLMLEDSPLDIRISFNTFHGDAQVWEPQWCDIAAADMKTKCAAYANQLCVPTDAFGTNHEDAIKSCFDHLKTLPSTRNLHGDGFDEPSNAKHIVIITDGDATVGETNPLRLRHNILAHLNKLDDLDEHNVDNGIVVHCLIVGEFVNREVPKNICTPTAGIIAFAPDPEKLSDEMSKIFWPIKQAPTAIVIKIQWGNDKPKYEHHGMLTENHRHVLLHHDVEFDHSLEHIDLEILCMGQSSCRTFKLRPSADIMPFTIPPNVKFEIEASDLLEKMAADAEEAYRRNGPNGMAETTRHYSTSNAVMAMPSHLQARFQRQLQLSQAFASEQDDAPEDDTGEMPLIGSTAPNFVATRMSSFMSQSDY
tara:strand:+ start:1210 stop:2604 length:1395 start_codon:yes stop_codon:yes gene_type:complete